MSMRTKFNPIVTLFVLSGVMEKEFWVERPTTSPKARNHIHTTFSFFPQCSLSSQSLAFKKEKKEIF